MKLYHEKTDEILKKNRANRQKWLPRSPAPDTIYTHCPEEDAPVAGQFDDEDLSRGVYDPLETPTTTPVQDEMNAIAEQQEDQLATASQQREDVPTSQAPRHFPTFTSPHYRQEELASQEETAFPPDMPELLSRTPGTTPKVTPKPSPRTTPKAMPQVSPNRPSPTKSSLRGRTYGTVNSPSGCGRGTPLPT